MENKVQFGINFWPCHCAILMEMLVNFEEDGTVIMHVTWVPKLEMPWRSVKESNVRGQATRPTSEPWSPPSTNSERRSVYFTSL